jgi:hypothetical protein
MLDDISYHEWDAGHGKEGVYTREKKVDSLFKTVTKAEIEKSEKGVKFDGGKLRFDLVAPDAHGGLVKVLTFGANKYADRNWENGMDWSRLLGALRRHIHAIEMGEIIDSDSGLEHIDHAQCCVHFLSAYMKRGVGTNDLPKLS